MINLSVHTGPFDPPFLASIAALDQELFGSRDAADIDWALSSMPDPSVHAAYDDGLLVGFKIGHALSRCRYFSWVGGVHLQYRRRGIARQLLIAQHEWARRHGYQSVETTTLTGNIPMLTLNLDCGFRLTGAYIRDGKHLVFLQKPLNPDDAITSPLERDSSSADRRP